jgi:uncharacterized protein YgfB (UPF0149 family)
MTDLTALALNAAHQLPVAELHGAVCGLGVCHGQAVPIQDVVELVGIDALTDQASVEEFVSASVADLQSEELSFAPLLPADDAGLPARLEALGQWCSAFLAGFAAGLARRGAGSLADCPEEVREIVRDFSAIAQVDPEGTGEEAATEAAEADFVELAEFVKVGTLLIMSTLEHDADDPPG